ncbi:MAG: hypothetical protein IIT58_13395 [Treponema sp.]|nr:hypothetical protein [Treponema sp.]
MLKSSPSLESIPSLVKADLISQEDALKRIAEIFSKNTQQFFISKYDSELISDLCFSILTAKSNFFTNYYETDTSFFQYLCNYLKFQVKTIRRNKYHRSNLDETAVFTGQWEYENKLDSYSKSEYSNSLSGNTLLIATERPLYGNKNSKSLKQLFKSRRYHIEKTILIVALKYCYYLSDQIIFKISNFCKIPSTDLIDFSEELKQDLSYKENKVSKIKLERDNNYRLKCSLELKLKNKVLREDEALEIMNKIEKHNSYWKKRTNLLLNGQKNICPSNKMIASKLEISERLVGYYLKKAQNLSNLNEKDFSSLLAI